MTDVFKISERSNIIDCKDTLTSHIINNNIFRGHLHRYAAADIVIAGGFFASVLNVEPPNDTDVFILNNNVDLYKHLTYVNDPDPTGSVWSVRTNASTYLKNPRIKETALNKDTKVQYILTDFKDRKELLADFDFVHCTTSYVPADDKLYITREAYDCIMKKELRNNKKDPPAGWRLDKFVKRGWRYPIVENKDKPKSYLDEIMDTLDGMKTPLTQDEKQFFA